MSTRRRICTSTRPRREALAPSEASENDLEIQSRFFVVFGCLWTPFGTFSAPFGHRGSLLVSLRLSFRQPLKVFRSAENLPRFRRELAEVQPRTCRSSAENLPRFSRESAKNQPRTRRMNPKQSCLSHCAFFEWTAFPDKRLYKIADNKSGAAVSPLGGLRLNHFDSHNI